MTATDELRKGLDELGVKWEAPMSFDGTARYDTVAGGYWFHEFNGKITVHGLTPKQAIAATLGDTNLADENAKLREYVNELLMIGSFNGSCRRDCRYMDDCLADRFGQPDCFVCKELQELGIEMCQ